MISFIRPGDILLKEMTQINTLYSDQIRLDPVYQEYHIFQTMKYFKVSPSLIEKTQQEFKKIEDGLMAEGK
jgi:hypothetical protein